MPMGIHCAVLDRQAWLGLDEPSEFRPAVGDGEVKAVATLRALGDVQPDSLARQVTCREPKDFETYAAEAAARGAGDPDQPTL